MCVCVYVLGCVVRDFRLLCVKCVSVCALLRLALLRSRSLSRCSNYLFNMHIAIAAGVYIECLPSALSWNKSAKQKHTHTLCDRLTHSRTHDRLEYSGDYSSSSSCLFKILCFFYLVRFVCFVCCVVVFHSRSYVDDDVVINTISLGTVCECARMAFERMWSGPWNADIRCGWTNTQVRAWAISPFCAYFIYYVHIPEINTKCGRFCGLYLFVFNRARQSMNERGG